VFHMAAAGSEFPAVQQFDCLQYASHLKTDYMVILHDYVDLSQPHDTDISYAK